MSIKNDGHYFCRAGGNRPDGLNEPVTYVRYADDFICSGSSRELLENEIRPLIAAFMRERGLEL
ncbi:hypothetical protein, partial [Escherichia coli]|uniref:hypothetical protein n=1 Tax=Escherichia coli TaxID=562 RepID=UPI0027DFB88F